jgi:hypothetical protein
MSKVSEILFPLDPSIRYVAVNRGGRIVEMEQNTRFPIVSPAETDRMEELLVNPTILDIARRRGEMDLGGVQFVIIRYEAIYGLLLPYREGHVSVGIEPGADIAAIADKCIDALRQ